MNEHRFIYFIIFSAFLLSNFKHTLQCESIPFAISNISITTNGSKVMEQSVAINIPLLVGSSYCSSWTQPGQTPKSFQIDLLVDSVATSPVSTRAYYTGDATYQYNCKCVSPLLSGTNFSSSCDYSTGSARPFFVIYGDYSGLSGLDPGPWCCRVEIDINPEYYVYEEEPSDSITFDVRVKSTGEVATFTSATQEQQVFLSNNVSLTLLDFQPIVNNGDVVVIDTATGSRKRSLTGLVNKLREGNPDKFGFFQVDDQGNMFIPTNSKVAFQLVDKLCIGLIPITFRVQDSIPKASDIFSRARGSFSLSPPYLYSGQSFFDGSDWRFIGRRTNGGSLVTSSTTVYPVTGVNPTPFQPVISAGCASSALVPEDGYFPSGKTFTNINTYFNTCYVEYLDTDLVIDVLPAILNCPTFKQVVFCVRNYTSTIFAGFPCTFGSMVFSSSNMYKIGQGNVIDNYPVTFSPPTSACLSGTNMYYYYYGFSNSTTGLATSTTARNIIVPSQEPVSGGKSNILIRYSGFITTTEVTITTPYIDSVQLEDGFISVSAHATDTPGLCQIGTNPVLATAMAAALSLNTQKYQLPKPLTTYSGEVEVILLCGTRRDSKNITVVVTDVFNVEPEVNYNPTSFTGSDNWKTIIAKVAVWVGVAAATVVTALVVRVVFRWFFPLRRAFPTMKVIRRAR